MKHRSKPFLLILIGVSIVLSALLTLNQVNFLDYKRPLTFEHYDQITFKKFRGLNLFRNSLYGNDRFAFVVTSIHSSIGESLVEIYSLFHPSRSFVYKRDILATELLVHEKYHIKITEMYAQQMKKEISELEHFDQPNIQKIIKRLAEEEREYQKCYDVDTFHSYIRTQQKIYQKEIDSLLNLLSKYTDKKILFKSED